MATAAVHDGARRRRKACVRRVCCLLSHPSVRQSIECRARTMRSRERSSTGCAFWHRPGGEEMAQFVHRLPSVNMTGGVGHINERVSRRDMR